MHFKKNTAGKGGGLSLESNSKLYMFESLYAGGSLQIYYIGNSAVYGGAIFVDDSTYISTCFMKQPSECFFQLLGKELITEPTNTTLYSLNSATYSGSILYGGLLDRCALSPFVSLDYPYETTGINYFTLVSNSTNLSSDISSGPVKVCFCLNHVPDCEFNYTLVKVRKGELFTVSVVAVDQVSQPVNATIQSSLAYSLSVLAEHQHLPAIQAECTDLSFSITSTETHEELSLYASDSPCRDVDFSTLTYNIQFLSCECPIGFRRQVANQIAHVTVIETLVAMSLIVIFTMNPS